MKIFISPGILEINHGTIRIPPKNKKGRSPAMMIRALQKEEKKATTWCIIGKKQKGVL